MNVEKTTKLIHDMKKFSSINSYNNPVKWYDEAEVIGQAINDITESCGVLVNDLFPLLYKNSENEEELNDILDDIKNEFEHIIYHIKDSERFKSCIE